jgi:hypothetical protein
LCCFVLGVRRFGGGTERVKGYTKNEKIREDSEEEVK